MEECELAWDADAAAARAARTDGDEGAPPDPPRPRPWNLRGFSDLTLVCGGEELAVHCNMVASGVRGSRVLRMSLDKPMREAATRRIDLDHLPGTRRYAPVPHL